ncbi:hypothetical protein CYY_004284 [Polysphondylium violaceum]|uniref:Uncharacterized protein n=1 Tax=Polysphondylium violaceum TaxID=133409 RepID=A0A8J4V0G5_9MYCE|nr:hypothetical protein CYY_004284 [Polysphondylium violaceum]
MDQQFYSIWRNLYIRSIITKKVANNKNLKITLPYLEKNLNSLKNLLANDDLILITLFLRTLEELKAFLKNSELVQLIDTLDLTLLTEDIIPSTIELPKSIVKYVCINNAHPSILPDSTTDLSLYFCQLQRNTLPKGLKNLKLYSRFPILEPDILPDGLETLLIQESLIENSVLPASLTSFHLDGDAGPLGENTIPPSVKTLKGFSDLESVSNIQLSKDCCTKEFCGLLNSHQIELLSQNTWIKIIRVTFEHVLMPGVLPPQLEDLFWAASCSLRQGVLPEGLTTLHLPQLHGYLERDVLPSTLTFFKCVYLYFSPDHSAKGILPDSLTTLEVSTISNCQAEDLPPSLTNLALIADQFTKDIVPKSIAFLTLSFPKPRVRLTLDNVPNLTKLKLVSMNQPKFFIIPRTVTHLITTCSILPSFVPHTVTNLYIEALCNIKHGTIPWGCREVTMHHERPFKEDEIPWSVKKMTFISSRCPNIGILPQSVTDLNFLFKPGRILPTGVPSFLNTYKMDGILFSNVIQSHSIDENHSQENEINYSSCTVL